MSELESTPESGHSSEVAIRVGGGAGIAGLEGKLPATTLVMESTYPLGTHLRLNIEARVKGMRIEEDKNGQLMLYHQLAIVSAQFVTAFDPAEAADTVGGSASSHAVPTDQDAAELGGLKFGRSSDLWAS